MSFTGRIRLYLILIALVPPLVILGAVWYESNAYNKQWKESEAERQVDIFSILLRQERSQLAQAMADAEAVTDWSLLARNLAKGRARSFVADHVTSRLDFL